MFTEAALRELLEYRSKAPLLSVYLNLDPSQGNMDAIRLHLRNMLREVNLPADEQRIWEYVDHGREWKGRSLAIFSCAPEDFFRAYAFGVPLRSRYFVGQQPYVKPIAHLLDDYGHYGIVLVDKQQARPFFFHLGELQELEEFQGEEVRHVKRGGASTFPGRRGGTAGTTDYEEEVVERNMKGAAAHVVRVFEPLRPRRLLLGGTEENVNLFRKSLPKALQSLIVGTFAMSLNANRAEVLEKALEIGQRAEQQREVELVEQMITAAAKGERGVVRLDETLEAVHAGRVQTLIVRDGYRAPGYQCQGCGYLTAQALETCPFCGASFQQIPDAVELVVRKVLESGGEVEIVSGVPALEPLKIGGLLRY
jgi:peptide subunit release factor 1 (eRF1)